MGILHCQGKELNNIVGDIFKALEEVKQWRPHMEGDGVCGLDRGPVEADLSIEGRGWLRISRIINWKN